MSISKNFVVKNGFEVSTDLILANADTRKVGVGTITPQYTLHVNGGIGATDFYLSGIGTFVDELNVGLGGTVLTVLGLGNSIGIGTALPQYLLDIRSPVSTGQTALYVQGDVRITGDLNLDDVTLDDATIQDLTVTNTLFTAGLSTFNSNVFINAALNVSGITTLGTVRISSGIVTATSGIVTYYGDGSNLTGLAGNPTLQTVLNTGNTSTIGMSISGVTTLTTLNSTNGTITNLTGTHINVSGIITATSFFGDGSGLTSVGIGSTGSINTSGIITASAFFGNGSGLTGVGIGSTGSINTSGIITASAFFGDGSGLTGAGSTVFNDTTTNQEFFPLFTSTTTGTITASGISTSKLTYNPSTGTLTVVDINSTSDINLKENIKTVENSLEITEQLRGVSFDWKETGKGSYGVIAQELEEILPDLVKNGEVKSVNYNGLIGVLIEAVKELSEELKELKRTK
jgi:hypothetical protein